MHFHISTNDGVPIYRQIVNQVKNLVAARRLRPGDEMPAIRQLAQQLLINPNTVARAYRELETAGLLISRQGSGTVISDKGSPLRRSEKMKILSDRADGLITEAGQLGVAFEDLLKLLHKSHNTLNKKE